jgi:excisionase family DNA binding protein
MGNISALHSATDEKQNVQIPNVHDSPYSSRNACPESCSETSGRKAAPNGLRAFAPGDRPNASGRVSEKREKREKRTNPVPVGERLMLTPQFAADLLSISRRKLGELLAAGILHGQKVGGSRMFSRSELEKFAAGEVAAAVSVSNDRRKKKQ